MYCISSLLCHKRPLYMFALCKHSSAFFSCKLNEESGTVKYELLLYFGSISLTLQDHFM